MMKYEFDKYYENYFSILYVSIKYVIQVSLLNKTCKIKFTNHKIISKRIFYIFDTECVP